MFSKLPNAGICAPSSALNFFAFTVETSKSENMLKNSTEDVAIFQAMKLIRHPNILANGAVVKNIDDFPFSFVIIGIVKGSTQHYPSS